MAKEIITQVTFTVADKLVVADPCYIDEGDTIEGLLHVGLGIVLDECRGTWGASVVLSDEGDWGQRVSVLRAMKYGHFDFISSWERVNDNGVDSGQMFIGCLGNFPLDYDKLLERYQLPNGAWNNDLDFFAYGEGAVSSTGYGDGCYPVYVKRDIRGNPIAVEVRFLEDADEDEA